MGHSGQGNEASELDGDRQECVFCFCSPCRSVTCVRQAVAGWGMRRVLTREILESGKKNCTGNIGLW